MPSRRSAHSSVPPYGTLTIINQILCIDVKLPRSLYNAGTREAGSLVEKRRHPLLELIPRWGLV